MDKIKIYLKDSDKARLADVRVRIVREIDPREPCDNEDLVFEKAKSIEDVPNDALKAWQFNPTGEWFFTTAERCKEMVSEDPSYWTKPKLEEFARNERKLYQDWMSGHVYGYVEEKWDAANRCWKLISSCYGCYGAEETIINVKELIEDDDVLVCIDEEEMKYEFDNTEKKVNEFKD